MNMNGPKCGRRRTSVPQIKAFVQGKVEEQERMELEGLGDERLEVKLFWKFLQLAFQSKTDVFSSSVAPPKERPSLGKPSHAPKTCMADILLRPTI